MTSQQAEQIAHLINARNQLSVEYTSKRITQDADNYLFEIDGEIVIACVEVKYVQWYQWEICHLSVREDREKQGLGKTLIRRAEEKARNGNARIAQCTIRLGNVASEEAFRRRGYCPACCFFNAETRNYVAVWQKALSHEP